MQTLRQHRSRDARYGAADIIESFIAKQQLANDQQGPSPSEYFYPARPPMTWGKAVYRRSAFTADSASEIAENPDLEVGRTQRYLEANRYKPGNWRHVARLARVADSEGKTEIIIFYQESLTDRPGGAPPGNADEELSDDEAKGLFARFKLAVTSD